MKTDRRRSLRAGRPRTPARRRTSPGDANAAATQLLHVVMLVMRSLAADMRRAPTVIAPAQMGILMRVAAEPCTMSSLAQHQTVSLPTISRSVDMLVRRGWLERWIDRHDRRQSMLRLTAQGRAALRAVKRRTELHMRRTLAPLSAGERRQLVGTMKVLARVLDRPTGDRPDRSWD